MTPAPPPAREGSAEGGAGSPTSSQVIKGLFSRLHGQKTIQPNEASIGRRGQAGADIHSSSSAGGKHRAGSILPSALPRPTCRDRVQPHNNIHCRARVLLGWVLFVSAWDEPCSSFPILTLPISTGGAGCVRSVMEMQEITGDWQGWFCQFVSKTLRYCQVFIFSSLSAYAGTQELKAKLSQRLLEN